MRYDKLPVPRFVTMRSFTVGVAAFRRHMTGANVITLIAALMPTLNELTVEYLVTGRGMKRAINVDKMQETARRVLPELSGRGRKGLVVVPVKPEDA